MHKIIRLMVAYTTHLSHSYIVAPVLAINFDLFLMLNTCKSSLQMTFGKEEWEKNHGTNLFWPIIFVL